MNRIKVIAFTHKNLEVSQIGVLHISDDQLSPRLEVLKQKLNIQELMFLSTCNRVEFVLVTNSLVDRNYVFFLLNVLYPELEQNIIEGYVKLAEIFEGAEAVAHILRVATSIDSMVVGEREIITQVRSAYENNRSMGLTGDTIRILIRHTIETAKKVFTQTAIATNPVSIVSLAYSRLKETNIGLNSRVLIVGAGTTNTTFSKFLLKHGFTNFAVFNRTLENSEKLARELNAPAYSLKDLENYKKGFDVLITCTGSEEPIITETIYSQLLQGEKSKKIIVDLAIPFDTDPVIFEKFNVRHITVSDLKEISEINLQRRIQEVNQVQQILEAALSEFDVIYRSRQVELAMRAVPEKVKEIRKTMQEVFAKDLEKLDQETHELLSKMMDFMEKKYLSVPMKMAKEILVKRQAS
jgi:glutamyl-tRNA reductase